MSTDLLTASMSDPDEPSGPAGVSGPSVAGPDLGPELAPFLQAPTGPNLSMAGLSAPPASEPDPELLVGPTGESYALPGVAKPIPAPGIMPMAGSSFRPSLEPAVGSPGGRAGEAATVELPEPLQWLLEVVVGERWPAAIEQELHAVADVWRHLGGQVAEAHQGAEPAAGAVVQYNHGPAVEAFGQFWQRFSTHPMSQAVSVCGELEAMLRQFAGDVAGTKTYIVVQLEILAGEVALGLAGSEITLGVSDAVATAAAAATRALIRDALGELATTTAATAARMAVKASATELVNDATLQALRQANGGHNFDLGQWARTGAIGAVGGLVGGHVGHRVEALGRPSLVHSALTESTDQLAENAAKQLTDAATGGQSSDPAENVSLVARASVLGAVTHHAHTHHQEEFLPATTSHTATPAPPVPAARTAPEHPAAGAYQPGQITRALSGEN